MATVLWSLFISSRNQFKSLNDSVYSFYIPTSSFSLSDTLLFTLSASNSYHLYSIQITTRFILCILSLWWFSSLSLSCFVPMIFSKLIHTFIDVLRYQISSHSNKCNSVIPRFGVYFLSECITKFCNLYHHFKPCWSWFGHYYYMRAYAFDLICDTRFLSLSLYLILSVSDVVKGHYALFCVALLISICLFTVSVRLCFQCSARLFRPCFSVCIFWFALWCLIWFEKK